MKSKERDLGILVLSFSCLLVAFFKTQDNIRFESSFHFPFHSLDKIYSNAHYPLPHERIPLPLIIPRSNLTRREGKGESDFVFVDYDYQIYISSSSNPSFSSSSSNNQNGLNIKKKASLLSKGKVKTGRKPTGLAYGYLSEGEEERGEYVVVVITDGWTVICFDSNLNTLWESHVQDSIHRENSIQNEIAITISRHSVQVGDKGMVVVAGRSIPYRSKEEQSKFEHEHGIVGQGGDHQVKDDTEEYHFSYYSLDGRTGSLRWKHEQGDFYGEGVDQHNHDSEQLKKMIPEHSFKLHILSNQKHLGEMDWKVFKDDLFEHLPHQWNQREDTLLTVTNFEKKRSSGDGKLNLSNRNRRNRKEFKKENVVVAHTKTGLEVLHLYTGRPVCRFRMDEGLYQDINDDGIIDHVQTVQSLDSVHRSKEKKNLCTALVTAGIPHLERLFNGSICDSVHSSPLSLLDIFSKLNVHSDVFNANILTLPSSTSQTLFNEGGSEEFDVIFLISNGRMTSYRADGRLNWQIDSDAIWNSSPSSSSSSTSSEFDMEEGIVATLSPFSLNPGEEGKMILATSLSLVLIDGLGNSWISQQLPDIPLAKPVIGDVDGDGMNDVIVLTPSAIYAYRIRNSTNSGPILFFLSLLLLLLMGLFYHSIQQQPSQTPKKAVKIY